MKDSEFNAATFGGSTFTASDIETAVEEARRRLRNEGFVAGAMKAGDSLFEPTEDRVTEVARLILDGEDQ